MLARIRTRGGMRGGAVVGLITGAQIRSARAMLRWSAEALASAADVGSKTVQRYERADGIPRDASVETLLKIRRCFEQNGILILDDNGNGPGLRFKALHQSEE